MIYCISLWDLFFVFSPLLTLQFFWNIFTPGPGDVLRNWPFFSNTTTLQSRLSDFSKHRLQEKCFPLSILQYLEVCQKKVYNKVIWLTKHFYENHFIHFSGDVRKTTVMKVLEIIRKISLLAFLLKNLSCPIYPPITIANNNSTASVSFVCSYNFRNCCEGVYGSITF